MTSPTNAPIEAQNESPKPPTVIKVFGVGSAGVSVIERLLRTDFAGLGAVAINTDADALAASSAPEKLHLESRTLRGLGTGGDPERGRALAEANEARLKSLCEGVNVAFIVAGLGGGAGTGISPVLARVAKEAGALVIGFVFTPFVCEGNRRAALARRGLAEFRESADAVICLPNQKVFKLIDENTSVLDTFKLTNELLAEGVRGFWRLLTHTGLLEIHFADLCALLRDRHTESAFAVAEAAGPTRSREVAEKLLAHPLLDGGEVLGESEAVLVSLMGGPDLTMAEVNRVMEQINGRCGRSQVMMGAAIDECLRDRLAVTIIATRRAEEREESERGSEGEALERQLLERSSTPRPQSRLVPPPPELGPEQMQRILARQNGGAGRGRTPALKMRQAQLPLEIVSKGRFDKSEPTIHKGEDLDLPTYVRRGIVLN